MSSSATETSKTAASLIAEYGWDGFVQDVLIGGVLFVLQHQVIQAIQSTGGLLLGPVRALGNGMILLVESTIGNVILVFDAGTQASVMWFVDGVGRILGPLAQPAAVGTGMLSVGVFILAVNRLNISPLSFLQSLRN